MQLAYRVSGIKRCSPECVPARCMIARAVGIGRRMMRVAGRAFAVGDAQYLNEEVSRALCRSKDSPAHTPAGLRRNQKEDEGDRRETAAVQLAPPITTTASPKSAGARPGVCSRETSTSRYPDRDREHGPFRRFTRLRSRDRRGAVSNICLVPSGCFRRCSGSSDSHWTMMAVNPSGLGRRSGADRR
jgi:hypothetical protein